MPENPSFLKFDSLQARIWLAVGILAFVNTGLAIAAYQLTSIYLPGTMPFVVAAVVPFFLTAIFTGFWLVKNILGPIENVSLLAKSLERSSSASVPKTSGAAETDEILYSLHRNSRQITTLIMLMDDVAAGKTETALTPLEHADKLCSSFQRLISKVTDSIDAKNDLDSIQHQIERLRIDIQGIKHGSLEVSIRTGDHDAINDVSESVSSLIDRTNKIAVRVKSTSSEARPLLSKINDGLHKSISKIEISERQHQNAISALRTCNSSFSNINSDVSSAVESVQHLMQGQQGYQTYIIESKQQISKLRLRLIDTQKMLAVLRERSEQIGRAGRTASEIARRSNMVAINTSIQSQSGPHIRMGVSIVSEEISLLAERSNKLSISLSALGEDLLNDLEPIEVSLKEIETETFHLIRRFSETETSISELKSGQEILTLPEKISALTRTPQNETARIIDNYTESSIKTEVALRESERSAADLSRLLDELGSTVSDIGISALSLSPIGINEPINSRTNGHYSMDGSSDNELDS